MTLLQTGFAMARDNPSPTRKKRQKRPCASTVIDSAQLHDLFVFLRKNREFNRNIQNRTYRALVLPHATTSAKLKSLFYRSLATQSRGNLDQTRKFWEEKFLVNESRLNGVTSVPELVDLLKAEKPSTEHAKQNRRKRKPQSLWRTLKALPGWGEKTAAMFVKALFQIHTDKDNQSIRFLSGFLESESTSVFIPIDAVIRHIFISHLASGKCADTFHSLNTAFLKVKGSNEDMLVWDDLWFWGFITQRGSGEVRRTELNLSKLFAIEHAPLEKLAEIETRAGEFVKILNRSNSIKRETS